MLLLRGILLMALLLLPISLQADETEVVDAGVRGEIQVAVVYENGELIPFVRLPQLTVFAPLVFENRRQERFYWRTVRDVRRTLPYARMAGEIIREIDAHLLTIPESEHRAYMRSREDDLFAQFEGELRNLTMSQGRMLIRLIDREVDRTAYQIIRNYRGWVTATFWQGIARIFGSNLRSQFDVDNADSIIERVIMQIEAGLL